MSGSEDSIMDEFIKAGVEVDKSICDNAPQPITCETEKALGITFTDCYTKKEDLIKYLPDRLSIKGNPATEQEKTIFRDNCSFLSNSEKCVIIYRGEDRQKMFSLYKTGDVATLSYSLFLIGNKGKKFINSVSEESRKKEKWKLVDVRSKIFRSIFNIINKILKQECTVVEKFCRSNPDLCNYFRSETNKNLFVNTIGNGSLSKQDRIKIRDYYLTLIHHHENNSFYPVSTLLSVSTSYRVAESFAGENEDKLILFGYIPKERLTDKYSITFSYLISIKELLDKNDLPSYDKSFYPHEKEISLKGGLLPHYIIGYSHTCWNSGFEINPSFLKVSPESDSWILHGLPIDQFGFWEKLKQTNFSGAFYVNGAGEYRNEEK